MGLGQPMFQQQGRPQSQVSKGGSGEQRSQVMPRGDKVQSSFPGMKPQGQGMGQGSFSPRTSMYGDPFARVGQAQQQVQQQGRAQGQQMQAQQIQQMREMMQQRMMRRGNPMGQTGIDPRMQQMMQQRMMGGMGSRIGGGSGGIFSMFGQGRR